MTPQSPRSLQQETERPVRRHRYPRSALQPLRRRLPRAALARLSPIEMLKLLDEAVTGQLQEVLAVEYFGLFTASVGYLRRVLEEVLVDA